MSAPQPKRREQRRTHLDASAVPVERALLARAAALTAEPGYEVREVVACERVVPMMSVTERAWLAGEFRTLAEELHWH